METTEKITNYKLKKRNDMILLVVIIVLAMATAVLLWGRGKETGMTVVVSVAGKEFGRYSLLQEQEIPIGDTNVLIIKNKTADMISAECPDQLCVKQPPISKTGEMIICLPNKVVVTVEGLRGEEKSDSNSTDKDDEIDIMVK